MLNSVARSCSSLLHDSSVTSCTLGDFSVTFPTHEVRWNIENLYGKFAPDGSFHSNVCCFLDGSINRPLRTSSSRRSRDHYGSTPQGTDLVVYVAFIITNATQSPKCFFFCLLNAAYKS